MAIWKGSRHSGVRYREHPTEKFRGRPKKYFVIRYKRHGRLAEEAIGWESTEVNAHKCADIRNQILSNIRTGQGYQSLKEKRGQEEKRRTAEKSKAVTLEQAFKDFLETRDLKTQTSREYHRSMRVAFFDWAGRRLIDITRDMVAQKHSSLKKDAEANYIRKCKEKGNTPTDDEIKKRGGSQANLHMRFLRSLLNFSAGYYEDAEGGPLIKYNPVQRLSQTKAWYRVPRRQTIIKPHELPDWFKALTTLENETIKGYILFLLLTGSRREEGMTLEVEQIDLKQRSYTLLDPKNRQPLTLPLPDYLFCIIKERVKNANGDRYVFSGTGKDGHLVEPKQQVKNIIKKSGVTFTLHDLRRHFITVADSLDLSVFAIKRLVNHSIGGDVTSGYVVTDVERLRGPMQKIEDKILAIAGVKEKGKVIPLKRQG